MSTPQQPDAGLNWSTEPTATVPPGEATADRPAGSAAPGPDPAFAGAGGGAASGGDGSPLDGVIAKLPPTVQERPEALVGIAFGAGIATAVLLRVIGR